MKRKPTGQPRVRVERVELPVLFGAGQANSIIRACEKCDGPMLAVMTKAPDGEALSAGYCILCEAPDYLFPTGLPRWDRKTFLRMGSKWESAWRRLELFRQGVGGRYPGGAPRKLTESDEKKLREIIKRQPIPSLAALTRAFNAATGRKKPEDQVHRHTIRRFLERHGLKLKQRPAHRS